MKPKFGIYFGLALTLAVGIAAIILAVGISTTTKVDAGHDTGASDLTVSSVTAIPNIPGDPVKMVITFVTPSQLDALTDTIIIEFEDDVNVPFVIDPSTTTIHASQITNPGPGVTGSVNEPLDVSVRFVGTPKDEPLVTLTLHDMDPTTVSPSLNGIAAGATVTVTFLQSAGLHNPTHQV